MLKFWHFVIEIFFGNWELDIENYLGQLEISNFFIFSFYIILLVMTNRPSESMHCFLFSE